MSARKKSRKNNKKIILTLLLFAIIAVGILFALNSGLSEGTDPSVPEPVEGPAGELSVPEPVEGPADDPSVPEPVEGPEPSDGLVHFPEYFELPVCAASETGTAPDHQIRRFGNYVICYRESYEQAEWAAYCLESSELEKNASRGNDFRPDPEITTGSASLSDYKKSGYDRGHLAPAADFSFSEEAMSESFYLSNMSPQAPGLNREIWQYLEGQVRTWAKEYGRVYVITGPVLEKPADQYESIGKNQVSVPEYYYKAILAPHELKAIGFIIPNRECPDTFWDYAVTIDEIESRTGLDFFALLEDTLENTIEGNPSMETESWK